MTAGDATGTEQPVVGDEIMAASDEQRSIGKAISPNVMQFEWIEQLPNFMFRLFNTVEQVLDIGTQIFSDLREKKRPGEGDEPKASQQQLLGAIVDRKECPSLVSPQVLVVVGAALFFAAFPGSLLAILAGRIGIVAVLSIGLTLATIVVPPCTLIVFAGRFLSKRGGQRTTSVFETEQDLVANAFRDSLLYCIGSAMFVSSLILGFNGIVFTVAGWANTPGHSLTVLGFLTGLFAVAILLGSILCAVWLLFLGTGFLLQCTRSLEEKNTFELPLLMKEQPYPTRWITSICGTMCAVGVLLYAGFIVGTILPSQEALAKEYGLHMTLLEMNRDATNGECRIEALVSNYSDNPSVYKAESAAVVVTRLHSPSGGAKPNAKHKGEESVEWFWDPELPSRFKSKGSLVILPPHSSHMATLICKDKERSLESMLYTLDDRAQIFAELQVSVLASRRPMDSSLVFEDDDRDGFVEMRVALSGKRVEMVSTTAIPKP